jgi:protein-tyrosine-phosphatase
MTREPLVLFVCSGNTCRSVLAEHLFRIRLRAEGVGGRVASAGLWAVDGAPASQAVQAILADRGADVSAHRSRPLTEDNVDEADVIVVMTESQRRALLARFPEAAGKVSLLKEYDPVSKGGDLRDPFGDGRKVYETIRDEIERALPGLIAAAGQWQRAKGKERA